MTDHTFSLADLDPRRIDFSRLPSISDLPRFELPSQLRDVELPDTDRVADVARDAAYVGVGLVVMTVERARSLRQRVSETLRERLSA